MGYFIGKIGRKNIFVLYEDEVELPSDMLGVAYWKLGNFDSLKMGIAKELKNAGFFIDVSLLI